MIEEKRIIDDTKMGDNTANCNQLVVGKLDNQMEDTTTIGTPPAVDKLRTAASVVQGNILL